MSNNIEDLQKEYNNFKVEALLYLQSLDMKLEKVDDEGDELKQEVKALEKKISMDIEEVDQKFEIFKKEIPRKTTLKIVFTILGATLSFLFASILRYVEHLF